MVVVWCVCLCARRCVLCAVAGWQTGRPRSVHVAPRTGENPARKSNPRQRHGPKPRLLPPWTCAPSASPAIPGWYAALRVQDAWVVHLVRCRVRGMDVPFAGAKRRKAAENGVQLGVLRARHLVFVCGRVRVCVLGRKMARPTMGTGSRCRYSIAVLSFRWFALAAAPCCSTLIPTTHPTVSCCKY